MHPGQAVSIRGVEDFAKAKVIYFEPGVHDYSQFNPSDPDHYIVLKSGQTAYLAERIRLAGLHIVEPPGGHAVYIDAGHLLPQIPAGEFPGQALTIELYLEGAIRGCEIGSVMFAHPDPETGRMIYPQLELLRLAIPRRTYTQSHMDYVAETLSAIASRRSELRGYKFTYAPKLLRHFTARFEPL